MAVSSDVQSMSSGAFPVTRNNGDPAGPPMTPIPGSMPITQQETPIVKNQTNVQQSKSDSGGGLFGFLGKAVGGLLGGLFSEGGYVHGDKLNGYAEGGSVKTPSDRKKEQDRQYLPRPFADDYDNTQMDDERYPDNRGYFDTENKRREYQDYSNKKDSGSANHRYAEGGSVKPTMRGDSTSGSYPPNDTIEPQGTQTAQGQSSDPVEQALATGYLIGAYHQQNYGGTPDTLEAATHAIGSMIQPHIQAQGFANGGQAGDERLAQQSLLDALGMGQNTQSNPQASPPGVTQAPQQINYPTPPSGPEQSNAMPTKMPTQNGTQGFANALEMGQTPQRPTMTGYMQPVKFAAGGGMPPMGMPPGGDPNGGPPPLQPGQTFQGDGSVKGPGGPQDDAIPAKLSNGEFVMSAAATQFFGVDKLNQMNEKGKQGFMQMVGQVDQNQSKGPSPMGGMPMGAPPMPQKPMRNGGPAMRSKSSGFMGL